MEFILASKSPRRKELMKKISPVFLVETCSIDEEKYISSDPIESVKQISFEKGKQIAQNHKDSLVISADTIVLLNGKIFGKPKDKEDAIRTLEELSGKTHLVITGYSIFYKGKVTTNIVTTEVIFNELNSTLIKNYVESKSPLDKAGAYGIQDNNKYPIIKEINGSYENVIGFPTDEINNEISRLI